MSEVRQQVLIEAPPEVVWELITDVNRHPEWRQLIQKRGGGAAKAPPPDFDKTWPLAPWTPRFRPLPLPCGSARSNDLPAWVGP
jgi:hypothetical protein